LGGADPAVVIIGEAEENGIEFQAVQKVVVGPGPVDDVLPYRPADRQRPVGFRNPGHARPGNKEGQQISCGSAAALSHRASPENPAYWLREFSALLVPDREVRKAAAEQIQPGAGAAAFACLS